MRLLIYSDLHLEFPQARERFRVPEVDYDLAILAGDIHSHTRGILWASETIPRKSLYVSGNHEAYNASLAIIPEMRKVAKERGVIFLENEEYVDMEHNVRFLGCTLWTDFNLFGPGTQSLAMTTAALSMNDFQLIRVGRAKSALGEGRWSAGRLSPADTVRIFNRSVAWLSQKLSEPFGNGKTVVVTHHLPSRKLVAERFADDLLSAAFASNLDHLVEMADVWIAGHTHDSRQLEIGKCRVFVNPRGYPTYDDIENRQFRADLIVEV